MDIGSTTTMYDVSLVFVRLIGMAARAAIRSCAWAILPRQDLRVDPAGLALNCCLFN